MEYSINMKDTQLQDKKIKKEVSRSKPKKKLHWAFIPLGILLVFGIAAGIYLLYKGYKVSSDIGFQLTPGSIFNQDKDPELIKDPTGKFTNVMLVGIDTRENTQLLNTDTIMIASYNYETKDIIMMSVPRDFHVQVNPDVIWFNRINSVYGTHEQKKEGSGLEALKTVVEEVTDIPIQYYAMIDYKGFVELIDAVGGVYVNVENSFTDYMYPGPNYSYQTVKFTEGPQLMDGDTALKYSRSRHSMQNGEGSDFARARRQQNVIIAFKDVLLSSDTLLSPKKLMDLMSAIQNNLKISDFTITDIEAGIDILKDFDQSEGKIYSFVLDPSSGNGSLITSKDVVNTGAYAIGPIEGLGKYDNIHEYVSLLIRNPQIYSENPSIYVYNSGLGYQDTYKKTEELRKEFKYLNIKFLGNLSSNQEGTYVYSHKEDEYTDSAKQIAQYLELTETIKPEFVTTNLNGENISVIFGKQIVNTDQTE